MQPGADNVFYRRGSQTLSGLETPYRIENSLKDAPIILTPNKHIPAAIVTVTITGHEFFVFFTSSIIQTPF